MHEIKTGIDQHADNQARFKLPTRTIAKIFVFRLIYGGSGYSYAMDPEFRAVSKDPKFWEEVIEEFYKKYSAIRTQHIAWTTEAMSTGQLLMPTGRVYKFKPYQDKWGNNKWPRTTILNYPVQGLGADIVSVARVSLWNRLRSNTTIKFISTVHDSIVIDTPSGNLDFIVNGVNSMFVDLPNNISKLFGVDFNLPLSGEISYGNNLKDLTKL